MFKKIWMCAVVVGGVVMAYLLMFALMDFFQDAASIASAGPGAACMTGYQDVMDSSPWWLLIIPGGVGIISIILILRSPEIRA